MTYTLGRIARAEDVVAVLAQEGERARAAVRAYLPPGQIYELAGDYPLRPGKGVRPALCVATCRAFGGRTEEALPAAAAVEMLHNAFLVHDDICDDASSRRGGPALHVTHGVPLALNAGNALAWLALRPLLDNVELIGSELALDVLAEFDHLTRRTIEGEAAELCWRERDPADADIDTYLRLVLAKTCWYSTIHPCRVGALIGSRGRADLDAIARFGYFLGAVLQVHNDLDNLTDTDGPEHGSDILEGKPTLPLVHLMGELEPAQRARVADLVGPRGGRTDVPAPERVAQVVDLMVRHGSLDYASAFADGLAGAAFAEFDAAMGTLPDSPDKDFVRSLVLYLRDPVLTSA
jgi:geranylgeranyl diphosphate synthase type II